MKTPYSQPAAPRQAPPSSGVALFTSKEYESNFLLWVGLSLLAHLSVIVLVWLVIVIAQFLGWNIPLFTMQPKNRDVEFVLVDNTPTAPPRHHTRLKAEHATRSGGQKIANRPTVVPQRAAGAPSRRANPRPSIQPQPTARPQPAVRQATRPAPQPRPQQQQVAKAQPQQRPTPQPQTHPAPTPRPTPPTPKIPTPTKVASNAPALPMSPFTPTIRTPAPSNPGVSGGGPIVKSPGGGPSGGSSSGASGNPGPSMIAGNPSRGGAGNPGSSGARAGGGGGSGGRGSYNQGGSPGGGGGRDGVDAEAAPDFGPYIAELQRRIRRNWAPPVEDRSKRVVAYFKISRDGRLLSLSIQKSSGSPAADAAAMAAVRASAPFRQLPPGYKGNDIDIQFIFDYEIYGHGNAQMR